MTDVPAAAGAATTASTISATPTEQPVLPGRAAATGLASYRLPDADIDRFLQEDVPYGDLTTAILGIGARQGRMAFVTRHDTVVCCTEETCRLLERVGCQAELLEPSGSLLPRESTFLVVTGRAYALHMGWKAALNLLEAASGVATRTHALVHEARAASPDIEVVATRKVFPGTKAVATKAVYAGGGLPHRLGLSESVLIFDHHVTFLESEGRLWERLAGMKRQAREKRIGVEVTDVEAAVKAAAAGADIIQVDKMEPDELHRLVKAVRFTSPDVVIAAAGGINQSNARVYAACGVDLLVTSAMYWGKPADIAVRMEAVD
jgi:molybdenum transport protein